MPQSKGLLVKENGLSSRVEGYPRPPSALSRRLEDRIRNLCAKLTAAKDSDEAQKPLSELQSATHELIKRLRARAIAVLGSQAAPGRKALATS